MGRKAEVQRMLLERLMGPEAFGSATATLHFTDPKVCRNFLCGTCPHDLFSNTKVDLGVCPKSHTPKYKDEYQAALLKGERFPQFEKEHEQNIFSFISDIDRKINANKRRLEQTPEEIARFANMNREISEIEAALAAAMAEVESLGEQGMIDESLAELQKAEALKEEKAAKERELHQLQENSGASGHQKLRVCDICGAYLSILDSDRRLADHFGGKMHLGYLRLREMIREFEDRRRDPNAPPMGAPAKMLNGTKASASSTTAPMDLSNGGPLEEGETRPDRQHDIDQERYKRDEQRRESRLSRDDHLDGRRDDEGRKRGIASVS
ncbi:uncharacterized protein PFL1_02074 [Pseudozyma flocculosa PF-1]|uniref:Related to LUC7 - essential protein associated with the U1 snRNP complex n=1 Tax=Pseudozyma flocculosa TaxID=84751 RepID=A0A5C3F0N3_9BASI|nr:uncharacterized protein PFL1_02074 [Pseudozyma flocculosa PF-1]EPQ30549.1 hypothetical protein PFL1_02074 [Pseudozyma flocculosa PF-1]SPO37640.1 related to LUC7 - essential protein associated with the U1 snRNP complex [Pseudozyma flocculosa]